MSLSPAHVLEQIMGRTTEDTDLTNLIIVNWRTYKAVEFEYMDIMV